MAHLHYGVYFSEQKIRESCAKALSIPGNEVYCSAYVHTPYELIPYDGASQNLQ